MSQVIKLLYFASLKEALDTGGETLKLDEEQETVSMLIKYLSQRGPNWSEAFNSGKPLMVSVNQTLAGSETRLNDGDEVAFFPPVTGG